MSTRVGPTVDVLISVEAPARLHMGFFDLNGSLGRKFGSLGLTLSGMSTRVIARRGHPRAGHGEEHQRALAYLSRMGAVLAVPEDVDLQIEAAIPAHAGLGSGTQLALAVGTAVSRLIGSELSAREVAHLLDRGARSGIGVAAFEQGGFVVDGGRGHSDAPPPLISRIAFPAAWRVLLLMDNHGRGLHGSAEVEAFRALPAFPEQEAARLCRAVLMQALPALAEANLGAFGAAITDLQNTIGDHFAPAQGGRFTSPEVAAALTRLASSGVSCLGQSSWGPTGFAVLESEAEARKWQTELAAQFPTLELRVCAGRNTGADISEWHAADPAQPNPPN